MAGRMQHDLQPVELSRSLSADPFIVYECGVTEPKFVLRALKPPAGFSFNGAHSLSAVSE